MPQGDGLNWTHILIEGAVVVLPTLLGFYIGVKKVLWKMGEYKLHRHTEKEGPLSVDGIIYPQQNGKS